MGSKKEKIKYFWKCFIVFSSIMLLILLMFNHQNEGLTISLSQRDRFLQENQCGKMCQSPNWYQYFKSILSEWQKHVTSAKEYSMSRYYTTKSKEIEIAFRDYSAFITSNCENTSLEISKQAGEHAFLKTWFDRIVQAESIIAD